MNQTLSGLENTPISVTYTCANSNTLIRIMVNNVYMRGLYSEQNLTEEEIRKIVEEPVRQIQLALARNT